MSKFCIVNFSNGGWYVKGQERLRESLRQYGHNFLGFTDYGQIFCPPHYDNPYAFKIYSILRAREMGYTRILWMDSSAWAIKPLNAIDEIIKNDGFFFEYGGDVIGSWTNDFTLNYFGCSRDEMMKVPIVVAGVSGFDFENPAAENLFKLWKAACDYGCFRGDWNNIGNSESGDERCRGHRHDLSSLSILAWKYQAPKQQPNLYLQYVYPNYPLQDSTYILLQGM